MTNRAAAPASAVPVAPLAPGPSVARTHEHLWVLWDGTPAHAPPERLTYDATGRLACHLCGKWFTHLGAHLRRHGWTAEQYREAVGLPRGEPLCSSSLSSAIAGRQKRSYHRDAAVRARFEPGQQRARSGELGLLAAKAAHARRSAAEEHPAVTARRRAALEAGRDTRTRRRSDRLATAVRAAGAADLHDLLRGHYAAGGSLASLAALTGLGRARLRAELTAAGVDVRPSGRNLAASKARRAQQADAGVAARLGVDDVAAWLLARRAEGATLAVLACETGRSVTWVRARLAGRTTTRGSGAPDGLTTSDGALAWLLPRTGISGDTRSAIQWPRTPSRTSPTTTVRSSRR